MFYFSVLLFLAFLGRLWLSSFYGLHPDEAYYWSWSRDLAWGYFDQPPLVAWAIRAGGELVRLLVSREQLLAAPAFYAQLGLRLVPYFLSCFVTPLMMGKTIVAVQRFPLRVSQMLVLLTSPVFLLGPLIVTPDSPLFAGWACALFFAVKFQRSRDPDSLPGDPTPLQPFRAVRMGIALAFCAYAKYSAIFPIVLFAITGGGLYNVIVAGVVGLLLYLPHLQWMAGEGMRESTGLLYQLTVGFGSFTDLGAANQWKRAGDLLFAQFALWTPLVFLGTFLLPLANFRKLFLAQRESRLIGTLFLWSFVPLLFFALVALKRPVEANWPLLGVLPATVLVLSRYKRASLWLYTLLLVNFAALGVASLLVTRNATLAPLVRPYAPALAAKLEQPSRIQEFQNWDNLHEIVSAATRVGDYPIAVETYQVLSELLFHDEIVRADKRIGRVRLKIFAESSRKSQFHTDPKYLLDETDDQFWLVAQTHEKAPAGCNLDKTLFKSPTDLQTFLIYRCGF